MTCKRGNIIQVPFPFSDLSATKKRPVLALTDADNYGDFLAVGITCRTHHPNAIPITATDLATGDLPVASSVRIDRVITINQKLMLKTYGQTNPSFVDQVLDAICDWVKNPKGP
jgi:mRNA interferase MazF